MEPRFQQIVLPSLWPRKKHTRGGEDDQVNEKDASAGPTEESVKYHELPGRFENGSVTPKEDGQLRRRNREVS